ncbi:MAG: hypothetical protein UY23_C0006G0046 [Candidatus Jorgensenbacteria bacterium GW2011_GWA1_48_11]|uniref:Uncharacterized protein n=1 Tax=Candidatus Jorgensenbacteria bacterium GW2011_GWA1_48_11 TaxID=1618660 RepID=A0A0G1U9Q5_9BACT|nr:MAG: hypothetical protein UY23_C0006G0046 [Candidatus Jorgensenbacteria bacterium GW2011_GWA1_48_11]KKW12384.1 MAG: hypothetical protein UY51_C0005G0626 [Candidatus Jorgensenbacteria bacterium GW2011_GWB1_49_9]
MLSKMDTTEALVLTFLSLLVGVVFLTIAVGIATHSVTGGILFGAGLTALTIGILSFKILLHERILQRLDEIEQKIRPTQKI